VAPWARSTAGIASVAAADATTVRRVSLVMRKLLSGGGAGPDGRMKHEERRHGNAEMRE
jgi:hypothetical protein